MLIISETIWPTVTKLGQNSPWVVPFIKYVWHVRLSSKMASSL